MEKAQTNKLDISLSYRHLTPIKMPIIKYSNRLLSIVAVDGIKEFKLLLCYLCSSIKKSTC